MNELCKVKKVKRGYAYVELVRSDKCAGCGVCSFNNKKSIVVPAACDVRVEVGQTVRVEMPTVAAGAATLLIYAVPIALMLIGALVGLVGEWWLQLTLAAAGLALGLLCAHLIDRAYRKKSGVLPRVVAVINGAGEATERVASDDDGNRDENDDTEKQPNGE